MKSAFLVVLLAIFYTICFGLCGYKDTNPIIVDTVNPSLNIISPNGGETFYIGDTDSIVWAATDANLSDNPISLWYTLSGGTYITIADSIVNSGSYLWSIPSQQNNNAKIRIKITDNFGNYTQKCSDRSFCISYICPAEPESLKVLISNNLNVVLNWQPVTHTINQTPIVPDGYIILCSENGGEDEHLYCFLGCSYTTNYTHQSVVGFRNKMFYRVIAYKMYNRNVNAILDSLCERAKYERILWKDAFKLIQEIDKQ